MYKAPGERLSYYSASEPKTTALYQPPKTFADQWKPFVNRLTMYSQPVGIAYDAAKRIFYSQQLKSPGSPIPSITRLPIGVERALGTTAILAQVAQLGGSTPDAMRQKQWSNWVNQAGVAGAPRTYTPPVLWGTQR